MRYVSFPPFACHYLLYMSPSWCAVFSGERKPLGLKRVWQFLELSKSLWCVSRSKLGFVCFPYVWHSCHGWLWLCGAWIQHAVVNCCFFILPFLIQWQSLSLGAFQAKIPQSWQQPTAHQLGSTEKRKQKMRYEVCMGWEKSKRAR